MESFTGSDVSRRRFVQGAGLVSVTSLLGGGAARAVDPGQDKIILGAGAHKYEWVPGWGTLPEGMSFGNTHGCIVIDAKKRILMNTDTGNALIAFDGNGKFLKAWGEDWKGGLHGMTLVRQGGKEVLYIAHIGRHEVVKATLDGDVLMTIPFPGLAGVYKNPSEYKPTSVAVAPNGNIYVGDGYGKSWVHQYGPKGDYIRSWGGPGKEPGKLSTPHGLWIDTRKKAPTLLVCDRGNSRIQIYDLEGKLLDSITGAFERPCHVHQRGQELVVADLRGRVLILDKDNKVVVTLGENPDPKKRGQNGVKQEEWRDGEFLSPHCVRWDDHGNLYVLDWNFAGRITKLKRV